MVGDYISSMGDRVTIFPNHTPTMMTARPTPAWLEIVQTYKWTKALSMAIDREEINQSVFFGTARMGAMCPMPSSKYYKEEYGTAWANYDIDAANAPGRIGPEERRRMECAPTRMAPS
jgi:peptide/nickel transport system substrate-binding protein